MSSQQSSGEPKQIEVSRADIFASVASEAGAFYKLLVTVASSFLGGTLVFLERISPNPSGLSLVFLFVGWIALIVCIVLVAFVRADNIRSGRMALESRFDEARKIDRRNRKQTTATTICLAVGLLCIMIFGAVNVSTRSSTVKEVVVTKEDKKSRATSTDAVEGESRAIPYGSTETPHPGNQPSASEGDTPTGGDSTGDSQDGGNSSGESEEGASEE